MCLPLFLVCPALLQRRCRPASEPRASVRSTPSHRILDLRYAAANSSRVPEPSCTTNCPCAVRTTAPDPSVCTVLGALHTEEGVRGGSTSSSWPCAALQHRTSYSEEGVQGGSPPHSSALPPPSASEPVRTMCGAPRSWSATLVLPALHMIYSALSPSCPSTPALLCSRLLCPLPVPCALRGYFGFPRILTALLRNKVIYPQFLRIDFRGCKKGNEGNDGIWGKLGEIYRNFRQIRGNYPGRVFLMLRQPGRDRRNWFRITSVAYARLCTGRLYLIVEEQPWELRRCTWQIWHDSIWVTHESPAVIATGGNQPPGATPPRDGDKSEIGECAQIDPAKAADKWANVPEVGGDVPPFKEGICTMHVKEYSNSESGGGGPFDNPNFSFSVEVTLFDNGGAHKIGVLPRTNSPVDMKSKLDTLPTVTAPDNEDFIQFKLGSLEFRNDDELHCWWLGEALSRDRSIPREKSKNTSEK
ncbi:hypothetical protein C8J57DRAFT_1243539 [Mycena rebaudengoi]|nr:hypothetical protein C8J57DRAFT_1243539 [Mycena rebaudengoi]